MHDQLILLAQRGGGGGIVGMFFFLVWLAILVAVIAGCWKMLEKAGQPGWGILIPFFNAYLLIMVAGRPAWWLLLLFVPLVNVIISIIVTVDIAKNFGKGLGFALGLIFLGFIFYPILGFGDARYQMVPH